MLWICLLLTISAVTSDPLTTFGGLSVLPRQADWTGEVDTSLLDEFSTSTNVSKPPSPIVKSLNVKSKIAHRYAHTTVLSRILNPANISQEVFFSVIIPETAFISGFAMTIDNKTYKAYVKEKEEAKREYDTAVKHGQTAAHVHQSARDSNRFSVNVNIEPEQKVTFNLTYEEYLQRTDGLYRHVINLNPGQIVPDLTVDVYIYELRNITKLTTSEIHSANEIHLDNDQENPKAQVEWIGQGEAAVHYKADEEEQRRVQAAQKEKDRASSTSGITGQLTVSYDVVHDPQGGEILINDGYFVHFFAPTESTPLPKHVLFVLDVSGSMSGRKIEQLREAMLAILDQLKPTDYFNIIEFAYSVTVRNLDIAADSEVYHPYHMHLHTYVVGKEETDEKLEVTPPFPATEYYIEKAKDIVRKMTAGGGTNIYDSLKKAVEIAKRGVNTTEENQKPQPLILFLTDGEPTVGETRLNKIERDTNELNNEPKAPIISMAFGEGADLKFLKRLSLLNNGFTKQIYEAADAALQLKNFYRQVSSPLLANVKFVYPPEQVEEDTITKRIFSNFFAGSELVVAGRLKNPDKRLDDTTSIEAVTSTGLRRFQLNNTITPAKETTFGPLERLWAYLTIRHLLEEQEIFEINKKFNKSYFPDPELQPSTESITKRKTPKEQALKIALQVVWDYFAHLIQFLIASIQLMLLFIQNLLLSASESFIYVEKSSAPPKSIQDRIIEVAFKYSFVCPLTSLVVVKPNGTTIDKIPETASPGDFPPATAAFLTGNIAFSQVAVQAFRPTVYRSTLIDLNSLTRVSNLNSNSNEMEKRFGVAKPIRNSFLLKPMKNPLSGYLSTTAPSYSAFFADKVDFEESATTIAAESESTDQPDWLPSVKSSDGNSIMLTVNGKSLNLTLAKNATDEEFDSCFAKNIPGRCKHLLQCVNDEIRTSLEAYTSHYLCVISGNFAGICCNRKVGISEKTITTTNEPVIETTEQLPTTTALLSTTI